MLKTFQSEYKSGYHNECSQNAHLFEVLQFYLHCIEEWTFEDVENLSSLIGNVFASPHSEI